MTPRALPCLALAMCAAAPAAASGQAAPAATVLQQTFQDSDGGWTTFGAHGNVSVVRDAGVVRASQPALKYEYFVAKGELNGAVLPVQPPLLAKAQMFDFWVKSPTGAPLALMLPEHEGGRYVATFTAPRDVWQEVKLSPADFALSENASDPKDPDGKLDLDQVEGVSLVDLTQIFAQIDDAKFSALLGIVTGQRDLYVSSFTVSQESVDAGDAAALDRPTRPQSSWIGIGSGASIRPAAAPFGGPSSQLSYRQAAGTIGGMLLFLQHGRLVHTDHIDLTLASAKAATLVLQLEERDGGKYNTTIDVPGGTTPQHVKLTYADLKPAADSHDANTTLDVDQISQLVILDVAGLVGGVDQDNTVWVGGVKAGKG